MQISGAFVYAVFVGMLAIGLNCNSQRPPAAQEETIEARNARLAAKRADQIKALPAAEHIKAGEDALARERSNDTRKPMVLKGQEPPKPSITDAEWFGVRKRLQLITSDQPEFTRAKQLLKAMDASDKQKSLADKKAAAMQATKDRKAYASQLEERLLEKRINADVTVSGRDNRELTIRWALASKVTARDLNKSGVVDEAGKVGFKKVYFTDGYNFRTGWQFGD